MSAAVIKRTIFDSIMFAYLASAIAMGFVEDRERTLMQLGDSATWFALFLVLGAVLSYVLNLKSKTLGEYLFEPPYKKVNAKERSWYKTAYGLQLASFLILTIIVGFNVTQFSFWAMIDIEHFEPTMRLIKGLTNPNWDVLPRAVYLMIETIFVAFMATLLAIPIAFVLSFVAAKNIMKHPAAFAVYIVLRTVLNVGRSVEAFIWAIIFSVWVGFGPFAGMLALMVHSIMSLTKQYSEIVETVNDGPIEGIQSTGATTVQTIWFAIVPQVILPYISFTIYRWDINIRMATIVGFVGGGGIGSMLQIFANQSRWPEVATIFVVIAFVVWFMDTASAYIREALK